MSVISNLRLCSLNVNGLRDKKKRRTLFRNLKEKKYDIICLQETHSVKTQEKLWINEWGGGDLYFSHGQSNSKGVLIIVHKTFKGNTVLKHCDNEGRLVIIQASNDLDEFIIASVYAPTQDKPTEQMTFITKVETELAKCDNEYVLLGGDFNAWLDPVLDCSNNNIDRVETEYIAALDNILLEHELCDIWRIRHPNKKMYTFRRAQYASRLDYWLVSDCISGCFTHVDIETYALSDHSIVSIELGEKNKTRGPGYWKFNTLLLKDEDFITFMEKFINDFWYDEYSHSPREAWDLLKYGIRKETMLYCKQLSRKKNILLKNLEARLKELAIMLIQNTGDEDLLLEFNTTKREIKEIEFIKTQGTIFRTKANWSQQGERPTKYFLNLEKRRATNKSIQGLVTSEGEIISDPQLILKEEKNFYEKLYSPNKNLLPINMKNIGLRGAQIPQISETERDNLDAPMSIPELQTALDKLHPNKCPGSDGLPVEFYRQFWAQLAPYLLESLQYSFIEGELSIEQKRGIITLIPKKDTDRRKLENWRPITLLNVDYKIVTKVIALRLQKVLPVIIHENQAGYVKGRNIGDNLRTIEDIISHSSISGDSGMIVSLDFHKAFDSLSWEFLYESLSLFGFGFRMIRWAQIFFRNISTCITNNGFTSDYFSPKRGVRQGCTVSPFYFIIALEILAIRIRNNPQIEGYRIGTQECKMNIFADDITCFVKNELSIAAMQAELITFGRISGLKINNDKSHILPVGANSNRVVRPVHGLSVVQKCKILGIWFGTDTNEYLHYSWNYASIIDSIRASIKSWKNRELSLKGRIVVYNTLLVSKLMYVASNTFTPARVFTEMKTIVRKVVWAEKSPKVNLNVLFQTIEDGGCKLAHLDSRVKAQELQYINKVLSGSAPLNKAFIEFLTETSFKYLIETRNSWTSPSLRLAPFWKSLLNTWRSQRQKEPRVVKEIMNEILWYNDLITVRKKCISLKEWQRAGIVHVRDIVIGSRFMSHDEISNKYNIQCTFLEALYVKQSLPYAWREKIYAAGDNVSIVSSKHLYLISDGGTSCGSIKILPAKFLYYFCVKSIPYTLKAFASWEEFCIQQGIGAPDWSSVCKRPFVTFRDTLLQSFCHRIMFRYVPTNRYMFMITGGKHSELCHHCPERDNMLHFFIKCKEVALFRKNAHRWITRVTGVNVDAWNVFELMLGHESNHNSKVVVANNLLGLVNYHIYRQRLFYKSDCNFMQWLAEILLRLQREKFICKLEKKPQKFKKWLPVYDSL